jgi:hypothetical protein
MNLLKDKKAIAPIFIFIFIILGLIGVYLFLLIPLPSFIKIRAIVNYFLLIILWFVFQGLIVYGYFRLGKLAVRGFSIYRGSLRKFTDRIKNMFEV